jgi:hypothetical protein
MVFLLLWQFLGISAPKIFSNMIDENKHDFIGREIHVTAVQTPPVLP